MVDERSRVSQNSSAIFSPLLVVNLISVEVTAKFPSITICDYLEKKKGTTTYRANSHEKSSRRQACTDVITVLNAAFRIFPRAQVRSVIMTPTKITGTPSPSFGIPHVFLSNNIFNVAEIALRENGNNIIGYQFGVTWIFETPSNACVNNKL